MLPDDLLLLCEECGDERTLKEWADATIGRCLTRAMRRDYRDMRDSDNWKHTKERYYDCPNCGKHTKASTIVVLDRRKEYAGIGRRESLPG